MTRVSRLSNALNYGIVLKSGVAIEKLTERVDTCFIIEEPLMWIDVGVVRNHWEIGVMCGSSNAARGSSGFLISTSSSDAILIYNGYFNGSKFVYDNDGEIREARVLAMSKCSKNITVKDIAYNSIERIRKHPYRLFYDNCHNNALYEYLNIIGEIPHKELINITNTKIGLRMFK